jgi:O-antigen/teichoic acid export membrane protein
VAQDPAAPAEAPAPPPRAAAVAASAAGGLAVAVLVKARGLIVVPLYAWLLDPAGIGIVNLAGATATLLAPFLHLGLPTGMLVELPHLGDRAAGARAFASGVAVAVAFSLVALALLPGALAAAPWPALVAIRPYAAVVAVFAAGLALREVAQIVPQLRRQVRYLSGLAVAIEYGSAAIGLGLVALGGGPGGLLWGTAGVLVAGALLAFRRSFALTGRAAGWDRAFLGRALAIGLPMLAITTAYTVVQTADRFFLAHHHGTEAVGIYSIAYTVASGVLALAATVNLVFLPVAVALLDARSGTLLSFVQESLRFLVLAAGLSVAGAFLVGGPALRLLAGPRYDAGGALLPFLAAGYALFTIGQLLQWVPLTVARRVRGVAGSHLAAAALNLALAAAWIPRHGMAGATAAAVVSYAAGAALLALVAGRSLPGVRWLSAGPAAALAVGASAACAWLRLGPGAPWWAALAAGIGLMAAYVAAGLATGALRRRDLDLLRAVARGRAPA